MSVVQNQERNDTHSISFGVFKEKLGDSGASLSDAQIRNLMELQAQAANALFDVWLRKEKPELGKI